MKKIVLTVLLGVFLLGVFLLEGCLWPGRGGPGPGRGRGVVQGPALLLPPVMVLGR